MKKLVLMLLALTIAICLFSCGGGGTEPCDVHVDENSDNVCDVCGEAVEDKKPEGSEVKLIDNGVPTFQFVYDGTLPSTVRLEVNSLVSIIKKATGVEVEIRGDDGENVQDCEILVGRITSRGEEYDYDYHELGPKGTAVQVIGSKIVISGGTEDALIDLLGDFAEDFLGIEDKTLTEQSVTVTADDGFIDKQTDFRIKSLSVGETLMENHSIIIDTCSVIAKSAAASVQNTIYSFVGYWLPIVDIGAAESTERAIVIKILPKDGVSDGYKLYVDGSSIVFEIMFDHLLEEKVNDFLAMIKIKSGDVKLTASSVNKTENIRVVKYSQFKADKNGETDASVQIKAAHDYANKYGHDVKADAGTYLIGAGNGKNPIIIQTNVDWTDAKFIIDDRNLTADSDAANTEIIRIKSKYKDEYYNSKSDLVKSINEMIKEGNVNFGELETFFGFKPGFTCLIRPVNSNHKVYIRYGGNANSGNDQNEVLLVDAEGNIDENTPFFFDYNEITGVYVYRADDEPITIKGGTFTTRANSVACSYSNGFVRGIEIYRSNVTISGLTHKITDEGDTGSCYEGGFIAFRQSNNGLVEDCVFQAHRVYIDETILPDGTVKYGTPMGTYELGARYSNNLLFKNCTQSNFYDKNGVPTTTWYDEDGNTGVSNQGGKASVWGVMGSNYSKNIAYDSCVLNRFDAHCGVYNATLKDCEIININLIGGGVARIEDCNVYNAAFVDLRRDYGSTWRGDIEIVNSTLVTTSASPYVFSGAWYYHYFGFTCYLPNLLLDNVSVSSGNNLYYLSNFSATLSVDLTPEDGDDTETEFTEPNADFTQSTVTLAGQQFTNVNPVVPPTSIIVRNCGDLKLIGAVQPQISKIIETVIRYEKE